jgi:hypothetical protein
MKKTLLLTTLILTILLIIGCTETNYCGDNICSQGETPENCSTDCGTGITNETNKEDTTNNQETNREETITLCKETDNGQNYTTPGITILIQDSCKNTLQNNCIKATTKNDHCKTNKTLTEYYCENKQIKTIEKECENNCYLGACQ